MVLFIELFLLRTAASYLLLTQQRGTAENHGTGIAKPGHSLVALNLFFFFLFQFFADTLSTGSSIRDHLPREKETGPAGPLIMPLIMPARPFT